jgi:hypothetical protein
MAISSNGLAGLKPGVCTSTTRPSGPYEGQMIYETDTDMVAIWNGTTWRYISATTPTNGTVLQVTAGAYSSQVGNATGTYATTGLSASITPKSSSSKILINVSVSCSTSQAGAQNGMRIVRAIGGSDTVIGTWTYALYNSAGFSYSHWAQVVLESPNTTSACTYRVEFALTGGGGTVYVQVGNTTSNMVLQEIAG